MKIKKDKYLRERGGTAKIIDVSCMACSNLIFVYQKDGPGWLKRCYLNRIISPEKYSELKNKVKKPEEVGNLVCVCGKVIGSPFLYRDGRITYHLIRGNFKRSSHK